MADTKWYCLRVVSNKERKIKERLDLMIDRSGWQDIIPHIIVPTEKIYKIRNGKKVIQERTLTPGYIMVEAVPGRFSSELIQSIASSKDVIHFLGREIPEPMKDDEVRRLLSKVDSSKEEGESLAEPYIIGEEVKVTEGPFQNFVGTIQEVNEEKKKLTVIIKVFGRGTEVELNFMQVEKQS
jgi:transcriptional antiterminator NusG